MSVKKYLLSLTIVCSFFSLAHAQYNPYWQWAKADTLSALNYSGAGSVLGVKNGKILWGRITGNAQTINGSVMGQWTFTEYDTTGKQTNSVVLGGTIEMFDAQADAQGNWYLLGRFWDIAQLPGTTLSRPVPATNPDADHFMLRIRAGSFTKDWHQMIGNLKTVSCRAFTIDNNRIILAADSSDATYVRSLSLTTGAYTPMFRQGGKSQTTSIVTDASGSIYMAGSCADKGSLDFNGNVRPLPAGNISNAYIAAYLPTYANTWSHIMRDQSCMQRKLTLFKNQYLFYTGTMMDSLTLGTYSLSQPVGMAFMNARLDVSGNVLWARKSDTFGNGQANLGTAAFHAVVTPDTGLVFFAQGFAYMNWGNGITTDLFGTYSSVVVSSDINGTTRWARSILGENVTDSRIASEGDAVWVSGNAYTNLAYTAFDTLKLKMPARKWVPYMGKLKLTQPPFVPGSVGGVAGNRYQLQPNPARNTVTVSGLNGKNTISMFDATGREALKVIAERSSMSLDVAAMPRGIYLLQIQNEAGMRDVRKVVLE